MLKVTNLDQVFKDLDNWANSVEAECVEVVKGYAFKAYGYMLNRSPQFSGDFVANWNISLDTPDFSFTPFNPTRDRLGRSRSFDANSPNFKRGDKPAMTEAKNRNARALDGLRLGQTIYFANDSHHDQGKHRIEYYAGLIESNQIPLRPVNMTGVDGGTSGHHTAYTAIFMKSRYPSIGKKEAIELKGRKL